MNLNAIEFVPKLGTFSKDFDIPTGQQTYKRNIKAQTFFKLLCLTRITCFIIADNLCSQLLSKTGYFLLKSHFREKLAFYRKSSLPHKRIM
jgi:hypothetical protein